MKKLFFATIAAVTMSSVASAQTITELLFDGDAVTDANAYSAFATGDIGVNGLVRLSTGSFVFFDTDGAGAEADSLILFDPSGSGAARFSILLDESTAISISGIADTNVGLTGLAKDSDSDDIYALYVGTSTNSYFVLHFPSTGSDTFGTPTVFISDAELDAEATTGGFGNRLYFDPFINSVVVMLDNGNNANDADNGFYARTEGTTDALVQLATFAELGAGTTPASTSGTDAIGFISYVPISATEFIAINQSGIASSTDGDIVLYNTATDSASIFIENDTLTNGEAGVGTAASGSIGLWLFSNETAVNGFNEDVVELNLTSKAVTVITTDDNITNAHTTNPGVDLAGFSDPFFGDGAGKYWLFTANNVDESLIEIDNTTNVSDWSRF